MRNGVDIDYVFVDSKSRPEWRCQYCIQTYLIVGGTRNPTKHLEKLHDIHEDSPQGVRAKNVQESIRLAMESASSNSHKRRRLNSEEPSAIPLDGNILEILFTKFITACNQPLRIVECPEFRAFLTYINSNIDTYLPGTHNTIGEWVKRQFKVEKDKKGQRIRNAHSKVHISTDLWTSPNSKAIMVVCGHFLSEDNVLEHMVLDLVEVNGTQEGINFAPILLKTLINWGITTKLGFFVMDNAPNNDTMIK